MLKSIFPKKNKYSDIKEAPLIINNVLKDESKRKIIRSLRSEKKYLTIIAKDVDASVAKVKYHLNELNKLEIVNTMTLTREKFFMLTETGRWCLKAIDIYYPENFYASAKIRFSKRKLKPLPTKPIEKM